MHATLGLFEGGLSPLHLLVILVLFTLPVIVLFGLGVLVFKVLKRVEGERGPDAGPVEPPTARVPPSLPPSAPRLEDNPNPPQA
jgi:hypothetical protein